MTRVEERRSGTGDSGAALDQRLIWLALCVLGALVLGVVTGLVAASVTGSTAAGWGAGGGAAVATCGIGISAVTFLFSRT